MATYVLLTKVTAAGVKTLQSNPRRIKKVNEEIEAMGARVVAQYATLGRYDFVNIVEAKDNETISRVSVGLAARGTLQIETLSAIPIETFIRSIGKKTSSAGRLARPERPPPLRFVRLLACREGLVDGRRHGLFDVRDASDALRQRQRVQGHHRLVTEAPRDRRLAELHSHCRPNVMSDLIVSP